MIKHSFAILLMLSVALVVLPCLADDTTSDDGNTGEGTSGRETSGDSIGEDTTGEDTSGQDTSGRGGKDDKEREDSRREWKDWSVDSDRLIVVSESRNPVDGSRNKFKFEVKTESEDHARLQFEFFRETSATEASYKFRVDLLEVIEYNDVGTAGNGFDGSDVDSVVSTYEIGSSSSWRQPTWKNYTLADGTDVREVNFTTTDGIFSFSTRLANELIVSADGAKFTPEMIKINIAIYNFPYQGTGTSLALKTRVVAKESIEKNDDSQDDGSLVFGSGFFSWVQTVVADGQDVSVKASKLEDDHDDQNEDGGDRRRGDSTGLSSEDDGTSGDSGTTGDSKNSFKAKALYFAYLTNDQPSSIYWDPSLGADTSSSSDAGVVVIGRWLFAAVALVCALAF